jgi:ubiquinone/menaquinone biosynthesis C-methylase UbiE
MTEIKNIALGQPIEYGFVGIKRRLNLIKRYIDLSDKYLLDIGAGNGAQTLEFLKICQKCVAIDIEKERLETFKNQLRRRKIQNCEIKMMDAKSLDFPDNTFDIITCIETLEHIRDQERALSEMHRVLKKNGDLVLSVPNKWWIFETHGAKLPLLAWNRVPFFSWLPKRIHDRYAYARIYTSKEIINLLKEEKFRDIKIKMMMPPLDRLKNKFLQKILRKIFFKLEKTSLRIFGVSIFVFAKK